MNSVAVALRSPSTPRESWFKSWSFYMNNILLRTSLKHLIWIKRNRCRDCDVINNFWHSYAEIMPSDWLKIVMWLGASKRSALFQHSVVTYVVPKFVFLLAGPSQDVFLLPHNLFTTSGPVGMAPFKLNS